MPINVTCPGCLKRFKVSDKFAGMTGACPSCKQKIEVPKAVAEVHAPTEFAEGGRSAEGKLITKPIERDDPKATATHVVAIAGGAIGAIVLAWLMGRILEGSPSLPILAGVGLVLISPALVIAAYTFLRDADLEPYSGTALYIRAAICGLVYALGWGALAYLKSQGIITEELWTWGVFVIPMAIIGGMTSMAAFDLEPGNAGFHFAFFAIVTVLLHWLIGLGWPWELAKAAAAVA